MTHNDCLRIARKHLGNGAEMDSSARHCFEQAINLYDLGKHDYAAEWALRALSYSVGVFHQDHKRVSEFVKTQKAIWGENYHTNQMSI